MAPLLVALGLLLSCYSYSNAQVSTGPTTGQSGDILILGNGWQGTLSQCIQNVNCWAGSSDQGDIHMAPQTNNGVTYYWSGTQQTLTNTIALNTALAAAGIQVDGFDYQWVFKNGNANYFSGQPGGGQVDPFEIVVNVYDSNGNLFKTYKYDYGNQFANWTYDQGTEAFNQNYLTPSYFGNVEVNVTGQDIAGQAGYWGPEFRADESYIYVNYSQNPCYNNALYDPACPGYANALFQQQCTINPLFDPTCTGYFTAQCNMNSLYDPACPGYSTANFTTQCNNDPLSDPACPDYFVAQCKNDPLYDMACLGYDTAYFDQQCGLDAQYDDQCPGYVDFSGNDDGIVILDPIIDDVVNVEVDTDFYEPNIPVYVPDFEYTEENNIEADTGTYEGDMLKLEDDIEKEIAQLEKEEANGDDGALNLEDDIENEINQLESSTNSKDFEDPTNAGGKGNMEDDIEKEIAALESEENTELGDEEQVESDGVQKPGSDVGPDTVVGTNNKNTKRKVVPNKNPTSRRDKMKMLIAQKAIETTRELERAVTLEQQMDVQRRLLALISYVPDFKDEYTTKEVNQVNFYPPKPTVDHAFARWFLNDPNFGAMENLQYPNLKE